ncbi:hypothetical protein Salat_2149700 [Sesamum alatum]|uniref:Uncharacterized protein n=1 Tax=Sesamum alatum TaxID=300844 RepID=A0AAE1Y1H1_9LAMI|nr:hypothetical protein Salat_2149700 [Sesamum alatum]
MPLRDAGCPPTSSRSIRSIEEANENLKSDLKDPRARHADAEEQLKAKVQSLKTEVETLRAWENKPFKSRMAWGKSDYVNSAEYLEALKQAGLGKALKDGFDPRTISFFKDAELEDHRKEVVVDSVPEDEFVALVESVPSHPSFDVVASSVTPPGPS